MTTSENIDFIKVTPENVTETGIYCIKNQKAPGYQAKLDWFRDKMNTGLTIFIAKHKHSKKQLGFIEYIPSELAWRPIKAKDYLFIQCIGIFTKEFRSQSLGSKLIHLCEKQARKDNKNGICTMSSDGAWMANKTLFEKNGFSVAEQLDRFELMDKKILAGCPTPSFNDWTKRQADYRGWHLVYADQCPWHEKSVKVLQQSATLHDLQLHVKKLKTPEEAQRAPSGFGTFSLLKDGKILADHYISQTRFENIIRKELNLE